MNLLFYKFLVILFLFIGESFYLYSEMFIAKNAVSNPSKTVPFVLAILIVIAGGVFFLGSVYFGMHLFKNIWIIAVMSVAAIVIMEPILAWLFFKQLPTIKTGIGFTMGAVGLIIALL